MTKGNKYISRYEAAGSITIHDNLSKYSHIYITTYDPWVAWTPLHMFILLSHIPNLSRYVSMWECPGLAIYLGKYKPWAWANIHPARYVSLTIYNYVRMIVYTPITYINRTIWPWAYTINRLACQIFPPLGIGKNTYKKIANREAKGLHRGCVCGTMPLSWFETLAE